ncbi:MAG: YgjV family protein [Oscillospiraceae bacterium]|nr:YgjV family protein [Oscillospiraceae bacterium]
MLQLSPEQRLLLIGNAVSFAAALFTLASAWSRERGRIYLFQTGQCLLLALANVFFASLSGVTTFVLCAARNYLLARDRFTPRLCVFFAAAVTAVGLAANNRGLVGLLPVVTTVIYTVACLYVRRTRAVKCNIIVNLVLWAVYDVFILDLVSCAVDGVGALAAFLSLFRKAPEDAEAAGDP